MTTTFNNYLCHTNTWYWGTSIDIVHKKGIGIICVKLDDDDPLPLSFATYPCLN